MPEAIPKNDGKPSPEGLDTSLGHGMVISTSFIERYVVVESDHPLLTKESPVGRSEYGALVVSASLPTKPEKVEKINPGKDEKELPTQSKAVRKFLEDERRPQISDSDIDLAA